MAEGRSKILLAVDGSDQAFEAARYASKLFSPNHIEVVLFHVATQIPESFWDTEKYPALVLKHASLSDWRDHQKKKIEELMENARQLFLDRGVQENAVRTKIQERQVGIARDIIHESQRQYNAVILGRWGMSLLKDFMWRPTNHAKRKMYKTSHDLFGDASPQEVLQQTHSPAPKNDCIVLTL